MNINNIESKACDFFIPNVFSPNGDGVNDEFVIELLAGSAQTIRKFEMYDRWGNVVFSIENIPVGQHEIKWDGNSNVIPVNPGVFVYYLELEEGIGEERVWAGEVTVVS